MESYCGFRFEFHIGKIYYCGNPKQKIIKTICLENPLSFRVRKPAMPTIPLSQLRKGAVAHIDSIVPNPVFGELDALVSRRLADLGFSGGMPLQVIAVGGFGRGPFAVRLGNQSQFSLRQEEAGKIMCHVVDAEQKQPAP